MAVLGPEDIVSDYAVLTIAEKIRNDVRSKIEAEVKRLVATDIEKFVRESLAEVEQAVTAMQRPQFGQPAIYVEIMDRRK